jgi:hypothetical protein
MKITNKKLIISGNIVEYDVMEIPIIYGTNYRVKHKQTGLSVSSPEENEEKSANRSKSSVRRLVNANAFKWLKQNDTPYLPIFITFTFKDDIRDVEYANRIFSDFMQRLNYALTGSKKYILQYLSVIEFQDENRNGVIHYHVLFFNLRYMTRIYDEIKRIWKHGNVNVQSIRHIKDLGKYLVKYMSKNVKDERLKGKKKYFVSRGLKHWRVIFQQELVDVIVQQLPEGCIIGQGSWPNKHCKKITRVTYDMKNNPQAIDWVNTMMIKYVEDSPNQKYETHRLLPKINGI